MNSYLPQLEWIDAQHAAMVGRLCEWSSINTGSFNTEGLSRCMALVKREFIELGARVDEIELPPCRISDLDGDEELPLGRALHAIKHEDAAIRVFLGIHIDTVYASDDPFQQLTPLSQAILRGPGVADAKGGLVVLLAALAALERSPWAGRIGWEALINPDEELGSPGSGPLFAPFARRCSAGLIFEPALPPDGALVVARKGSANFTAIVRGKAAHAGRDPGAGRNAIHALAGFIVAASHLATPDGVITVNVGQIAGGGPVNVVPDRALCRFNVRVATAEAQRLVEIRLLELTRDVSARDGLALQLTGGFHAPPRPVDRTTLQMLDDLARCGGEIGLPGITWRDTGGVCDGNRLAAAGLPTVDSLGVRGGNIHSPGEFIHLDSLTERAKLSALYLMKLASGELRVPAR